MTQKFTHETLLLHSTASNTKFELDVWRYNHTDATQTVFLQGGIHGIELTGIPVVHEFIKEIEEHQLAYNFICYRFPTQWDWTARSWGSKPATTIFTPISKTAGTGTALPT